MSDAMRMPLGRQSRSHGRRVRRRSAKLSYPILLALVLVVGAASLIAWCGAEYSMENRASQGEMRAQYLLGKRFFDQARYAGDYARAARLIRKSADQGYAQAEAGLGLLYENGLGVPKNYGEALKWLRRAADQGSPVAQNELGVMYAKGRGVTKNLEEAAKWCRLAAAQGSEIARRNLELAEVGRAKVIPEIRVSGKTVYHQAILQKVESDGVTVSFLPVPGGVGVAKLKLSDLPSALQVLCTYATKQKTASDSAYTQLGSISTTL
jgi:TPR repeat protein